MLNPAPNDRQKRPTQFSLQTVFAVTTGIALLFGGIHWLGAVTIVVPVMLFVVLAAVAKVATRHRRLTMALGFGLLGLTTANCLRNVASSLSTRTISRRTTCSTNLKMIGIAPQNYADVYDTFPPAYIADEKGRPMHSWRVLILPFMERSDFYEQYDFNEPWDGPHNKRLSDQMATAFQCPSDSLLQGTHGTCYLAVTGPQTVWPGEWGVARDDIGDGAAQTLAVVEVAHSGVHWMEPNDLPFSALNLGLNPPTGLRIGSEHPDVAQVLFCDGSVRALESTISAKTLKALATKSGGETIDEEY